MAPVCNKGPSLSRRSPQSGPKRQWWTEEAGLGLQGSERRMADLPPCLSYPLARQVVSTLCPLGLWFYGDLAPPCQPALAISVCPDSPCGEHYVWLGLPGTEKVKALLAMSFFSSSNACFFLGFLYSPKLPQPPALNHPRVSPACSCIWYSPCRPLSCPGGLVAASQGKQAGKGHRAAAQSTLNSAGGVQQGPRQAGDLVLI